MKLEDCTSEYLRSIFDYRDGALYWISPRSNRLKCRDRAGTVGSIGYRYVNFNGIRALEHRVIYLMRHNCLPKYVDHINQDSSNNMIENLRAATKSQNQVNSGLITRNKSGIKNVCWDNKARKWLVQLRANGKPHFLGHYEDIELAELVAHEARIKFHKEFVCHA